MPEDQASLSGQLLIAMPSMPDPRFARSVIYLCVHNANGAMGLVVNRQMPSLSLGELLDQLEITPEVDLEGMQVLLGGPVETGRGFVLHTDDFIRDGTIPVHGNICLTATVDILRAIASGDGPQQYLMALGYAGWGPGQLDGEIQSNGWLNAPAPEPLLFDADLSTKWERAIAQLGVTPSALSGDAGHA
ncbi:MAG: YqgE/AlgH family protein [Rhodospirillaceae bacterium]|nr:YqgE/AlgH family protein [Rhodospirillaceae bacterium]